MKYLIPTLLFAISCSQNEQIVSFDHPSFSLQYPESWEKSEDEGLILVLKKYSKFEKIIKGDNPNLIVIGQYSAELAKKGILGFNQFLDGYKDTQLSKPNIKLEEDYGIIEINGIPLHSIKFKVTGRSAVFLQTQYFLRSDNQYIAFMLTHQYSEPDDELQTIFNSLKVHEKEKLNLFE